MSKFRFSKLAILCMVCVLILSLFGCTSPQVTVEESWVDEEDTTRIVGGDDEDGDGDGDENSDGDNTDDTDDENSNGGDGTGKGTGTTKSGNPTTQTTKQSPPGGKTTVTISSWTGSKAPNPSSATYNQQKALVEKIERDYNCTIKYKFVADAIQYYNEFVQKTAANKTQAYADIVYMPSDSAYPVLARKGHFIALDNYLNLKDTRWNQPALQASVVNGKHHYVSPAINQSAIAGGGVYWNKALFKSMGVKTPHEYIAEKAWTWDNFKKTAQELTRTVNGVQYYGFAAESTNTAAGMFIGSNGGKTYSVVNGKHVFSADNDTVYEAIQYFKNLIYVDKVYLEKNGVAQFKNGKVGMAIGPWYVSDDYNDALGMSNVGFAYYPIGKNPAVTDYNYRGAKFDFIGIPPQVKNPQLIANIMTDYCEVFSWRPTLKEQMENRFGDPESLRIVCDIVDRAYRKVELSTYYSGMPDLWGISDPGKAPKAHIDGVKSAVQAQIDSVWGQ